MPTILSKFATSQLPTVSTQRAGEVVVNDFFIDLSAAQLLAGAIIDLGRLDAYHTVSDMILLPGDLDSAAAVTLDVGLLSGAPGDVANRTCGAEFFAASTAAQTGTPARPTLRSAFAVQSVGFDRSIGVKIVAAPGTPVAGRIAVRVFMHASDQNIPL
jgi:hypothetical protein